MQEVWNRTNGESFDLNEFGDYTKKEFDAMNINNNENSVASTEATVTTDQQQIPAIEEEVPPAYYLHDTTQLSNEAKPKFKQVQTFSGGFRMVPINSKEADTALPIKHHQPAQPTTSRNNNKPPETSTTNQGQRFRKVRLFSGGFMIVPNNVKN